MLLIVICLPLFVIGQTQAEIDAKKQRVQDAMKANPEKAAEYQKMLDDLNTMKPGEGRSASSSRPAGDSRGGSAATNPAGSTGRTAAAGGGKSVTIDGVTYTKDSLPGPVYVILEWKVDPTGKKPSHANLDASDLKSLTQLYGESKVKNLQSQLNNTKSANEALNVLGTLRFFVKHQSTDSNDGWQRTSYLLEKIVPVKF